MGLIMTIKSPGDIIQQDALKHLKIDQSTFAEAMGMSKASISRMLSGKAAITTETAMRLEVVLNEPAEYWLGLQASYDVAKLKQAATFSKDGLKQLETIPGATLAMSMLTEIFHRYRLPSDKIPIDLLREVCDVCGVDNMFHLMRRVDPLREVFDYPYTPFERGIHGLVSMYDAFDFCSDYFGDLFISEEHSFPDDFLGEYTKNIESDSNSVFRSGCLVWNKREGVHGYLVKKVVGSMAVPVEKDIEALRKRFSDVECFRYDDKILRDRFAITAFVRTAKDFKRVPDIYKAFEETAEKWQKTSVKKGNRDRTFGDDSGAFV